MFHFRSIPMCSARHTDTNARLSACPDLDTFRRCSSINPNYCAECAGIRTDSDRYVELRKLVELWQHSDNQRDHQERAALLLNWKHR